MPNYKLTPFPSRALSRTLPPHATSSTINICIIINEWVGETGLSPEFMNLFAEIMNENQQSHSTLPLSRQKPGPHTQYDKDNHPTLSFNVTVVIVGTYVSESVFSYSQFKLHEEQQVHLEMLHVNYTEISEPHLGCSIHCLRSYQLYLWLKQRSFDIVHFPAFMGVAHFSLLARSQGLAFPATQFVVGCHHDYEYPSFYKDFLHNRFLGGGHLNPAMLRDLYRHPNNISRSLSSSTSSLIASALGLNSSSDPYGNSPFVNERKVSSFSISTTDQSLEVAYMERTCTRLCDALLVDSEGVLTWMKHDRAWIFPDRIHILEPVHRRPPSRESLPQHSYLSLYDSLISSPTRKDVPYPAHPPHEKTSKNLDPLVCIIVLNSHPKRDNIKILIDSTLSSIHQLTYDTITWGTFPPSSSSLQGTTLPYGESFNDFVSFTCKDPATNARSDYIYFMEAGDMLARHAISTFVGLSQNAGVLTSLAFNRTPSRRRAQAKKPPLDFASGSVSGYISPFLGDATDLGISRNCFGERNVFVRSELFFRLGGFMESLITGNDDFLGLVSWVFLVQVSMQGCHTVGTSGIMLVPEPLFVKVNIHDTQGLFPSHNIKDTALPFRTSMAILDALAQNVVPRHMEATVAAYISEEHQRLYQPRLPSFDLPISLQPLEVSFSDGFTLIAYGIRPVMSSLPQGTVITVDLHWRADKTTDLGWSVFVHLRSRTGKNIATADANPTLADGTIVNTWEFLQGEIVADRHNLRHPGEGNLGGEYDIFVGFFRNEGKRTNTRQTIVHVGPTSTMTTSSSPSTLYETSSTDQQQLAYERSAVATLDANEILLATVTFQGPTRLANSWLGFSDVQVEKGGWSYGYLDSDGEFGLLDMYEGARKMWVFANRQCMWLYVGQFNMHPCIQPSSSNLPDKMLAVRRYTFDADARIAISGVFTKSDQSCGDGVGVTVALDGSVLWEALLIFPKERKYLFGEQVGENNVGRMQMDVKAGQALDFRVDPRETDSCDGMFMFVRHHPTKCSPHQLAAPSRS
eukprot:TRINITY_DN5440_c0_g1_i1.p1 TRINITY_DN5440_c0_g1~~TRINITY_DN5440_c0_g1_i1.p1  ORF type:complete len:1101 (-),score=174.13 TRINITY_DN5440_c0_g1_i1:65-3148(-)